MKDEPDWIETSMGCAMMSLAFCIAAFTVVGCIAILIDAIF